jgi:hypothetical protein
LNLSSIGGTGGYAIVKSRCGDMNVIVMRGCGGTTMVPPLGDNGGSPSIMLPPGVQASMGKGSTMVGAA